MIASGFRLYSDVTKTAGVMADLARVYTEDKQEDKAKATYAQALEIYNKYPRLVDDELASFLETYGDFLSQTGLQSQKG